MSSRKRLVEDLCEAARVGRTREVARLLRRDPMIINEPALPTKTVAGRLCSSPPGTGTSTPSGVAWEGRMRGGFLQPPGCQQLGLTVTDPRFWVSKIPFSVDQKGKLAFSPLHCAFPRLSHRMQ